MLLSYLTQDGTTHSGLDPSQSMTKKNALQGCLQPSQLRLLPDNSSLWKADLNYQAPVPSSLMPASSWLLLLSISRLSNAHSDSYSCPLGFSLMTFDGVRYWFKQVGDGKALERELQIFLGITWDFTAISFLWVPKCPVIHLALHCLNWSEG